MIGTILSDRYEITGELGRGGMSVVYAAYDPLLRREVAVKVIAPSYLDRRSEEAIRREAQLVAKLDHPAIVSIHDLGRHGDTLYLVMPRVRGETLRKALDREVGLRLGDVLEIGVQAAQALGYSHSRGVVHRDIKPSNMIIERLGGAGLRVRILDFGLAVPIAEPSSSEAADEVPGTLSYLAPEQVEYPTGPADGPVDLYALGVVLYECLAGEPPFVGAVYATLYRIVHEAPVGLLDRGVAIDPELEALVLSCLEKSPGKRPQDGRSLAASLARYRDRLAESQWAHMPAAAAERSIPVAVGSEPLVGRQEELASLSEALSQALAGSSRLVVLGGEAGVGKTRLANEVERLAATRRVRVLHGHFSDWESAFPYQGLCELIQDYFLGVGSSSGLPGARVDLDDLAADLIALYPAFSELPELRGTAETTVAFEPAPSTEPSQIFELLTQSITRLAAGQPLVILLENLHAAEIGLDALQYLVRRLADTPTLVVGTYRSSEVYRGHAIERFLAAFAGDPSFRHLELGPLDLAGTRALVEHWVGTTALPRPWIERLHEVTEGNPLFSRELVQSLIESDAFGRAGESGWGSEVDPWSFGLDSLPATLQQAEERRLERLDSDTVDVLTTASILGRRFDYADLLALYGDETRLEPLVDDLVAQGLLSEEPRRRVDRLSFSSGILRDLLYDEMSRRRRRSLHARWARHLEQRHKGRLESVYPQLLEHYRAADRAQETVRYGLLLARWSLQHFSPEDAVRAARIALEFVEDEEVLDARRCEAELTEVLARGHDELGFPERALRRAQRAAELYAQLDGAEDALARTAVLAAEIAWRDRRIDEVQPWVDRGLPIARRAGDVAVHRRLLGLGATIANLRGGRGEALYLDELRRLDAQAQGAVDPPTPGGTMVCALAMPVVVIDPARVDTIEELEVVANLFETLLVAGDGGLIIGGLAERWWVDGSDVHFLLRRDLRFSDGSALDAEAVIASFLRTARLRAEVLPPVYTHLVGIEAYLAGNVNALRGLTGDGRRLTFHLREPLPIFPALLTDPRTGVTRPTSSGGLVGSGPFRLARHDDSSVLLERNPHHRDGGSLIDALEMRCFDDSFAISTSLQAGEIDLARDLTLEDFEALVRQPRWRSALIETVKRNVYFMLWNLDGPVAGQAELRRVMTDVVRRRELVWRTLGRLAVPATSLIPPGILGHDAGRRKPIVTLEEGRRQFDALDFETPVRLRCVVHPMFCSRCAPLLDALIDTWRTIGIETEIVGKSLEDYLAVINDPSKAAEVDLLLGRWNGAYQDPDDFTWGLFNSRTGLMRHFVASPELDLILERARQHSDTAGRRAFYAKFEEQLDEQGSLLPLFYDVDFRLVAPGWRGLELSAAPPFATYAKASRAAEARLPDLANSPSGGTLSVSSTLLLDTLDPSVANLVDHHDMTAQVFETLTRVDAQARILPWLAQSHEAIHDGRAYRFKLRDARFHDGRRLSSRDVRWSLERILRERRDICFLLMPIRGARAVIDGKAEHLAGCRILSSDEFVLELHQPLAFFPALLTHPGVAIVPEEQQHFAGTWREGCCGTGPFRVAAFDAEHRVELERHPQYWRSGLPKAERLVFRAEHDPNAISSAFRSGALSLASSLRPTEIEALRRSPDFGGDYQESPSLSTYYLVLNARSGPLADPGRRRAVAECLDLDSAVASVGRSGVRAHCLVPPGLLGYEAPRGHRELGASDADLLRDVVLRLAVHPVFNSQFAECRDRLIASLRRLGTRVETVPCTLQELLEHGREGDVDLILSRWVAAYPDPDCFATGLYAPTEGLVGGLAGSSAAAACIDKGRQETDPALRHAIYRRFEELLASEHWLLPLFHEQTYRFAAPGVRGLRLGITVPAVRYDELWIDEP